MKRKSVRLEEQAMRKYRRTSPERGTKSRPNSSRGPPVPARSGARSLVDRSKGGVQRTCPSPPDSLLIETPGVSTCKSANVAALQTQKSISKTLALEVFDDIQIPDMTSEIPQKEKGKLNNMHAWMRIFLPLFGPQMLGGEFAKALERRIGLVVHLPRKREPKVKDIRWMECRNETWQQCDTIATVLRNSSYANIHLYWFRRGKRYCHANLVGIDHKNKTFELFEPNGYETWFAVHTTAIVENLRSLLPEYSYQALEFPKYGGMFFCHFFLYAGIRSPLFSTRFTILKKIIVAHKDTHTIKIVDIGVCCTFI